jgi:hypothetical protein
LLCSASELVCLVADFASELAFPRFGLDDAAAVADLLEARYLRPKREPSIETLIELLVDGRPVEVPAHLADALRAALVEFVDQVPGGIEAREIGFRLHRTG